MHIPTSKYVRPGVILQICHSTTSEIPGESPAQAYKEQLHPMHAVCLFKRQLHPISSKYEYNGLAVCFFIWKLYYTVFIHLHTCIQCSVQACTYTCAHESQTCTQCMCLWINIRRVHVSCVQMYTNSAP